MKMSAPNTAEADPWQELDFDDAELQRLLDEPVPAQDQTKLRTNEQHAGFDNNVGDTWIYPSNLPRRAYQYAITQTALYRNTLVVLPTGLGKTFIAAVVMYNMYRWYPLGKVIFMAPTRPLVNQQIEACQRIMPFPKKDTVELTGKLQRKVRAELWRTKRVFFATPQVVQSDICSRPEDGEQVDFPFEQIKLIVIDEAHKAKGRYAYTEVAQAIWQRNRYHRVLALSATPGRSTEDVAAVVRNLFISHLEVRCDNSVDVMPYIHKRSMKTIVVNLSSEIKEVREELVRIIDPYLRQLIDADVLSGSHRNINRNFLLFEQKRFRERSQHQRHCDQAAVSSNFSICISLHHALELLERHGLRAFLNNFEEDNEGRSKFILTMDGRLQRLVERLRLEVGPNPFDVSAQAMTNGKIAEMPADLDFGHPKFEQARKCLLEHFQDHPDSRAIVFCEYRESVMLIYRLLLQHVPLLKPRCFVGQGGTTGSFRALTQKQQLQVMNDFRAGTSNILVATSVGEEGIDVGEVELIVCFDISTSNPTRFIQRIGRTGRKKHGKVVMLVTEGREQQLMKEVLASKDQMNKKITRSTVVQAALYKHSPRLVPTELNPSCIHTFIKPPDGEEEEAKAKKNKQVKKGKIQQPINASQDLRTFFKKQSAPIVQLDAEDLQVFQSNTPVSKRTNKPNDVTKFFDQIDVPAIAKARHTASNSSPVVAPARKSVDTKRLRRINKFLKSNTPILPASQRKTDLASQLNSEVLPRDVKLQLVKEHHAYITEVYEKMQVLLALDMDATAMSEEEQNIRATYESLIGLFVNNAALGSFLDKQNSLELEVNFDSDNEDVCPISEENFQSCFDAIFKGFDVQGRNRDNYDYIQAEFMKTDYYQNLKQEDHQSGENNSTTQHSIEHTIENDEPTEWCSNNFTTDSITDSKYFSQWDQLGQSPIGAPKLNGPLVNAFNRQRSKAKLSESTEAGEMFSKSKNNSQDRIMDFDNEDVIFIDEERPPFVKSENSSDENVFETKPVDVLQSITHLPQKITTPISTISTPKAKSVMCNSSTPLNDLRKFKEEIIETSPIVKNLRTLTDSMLFCAEQEANKSLEETRTRPSSATKLHSIFSSAAEQLMMEHQKLNSATQSKTKSQNEVACVSTSPKKHMNHVSSPDTRNSGLKLTPNTPNKPYPAVFMRQSSTPHVETKTQVGTLLATNSATKALPTKTFTTSSSTSSPTLKSAAPASSIKTSGTRVTNNTTPSSTSKASYNILDELDFDMDAFLEPFPEEITATEAKTANSNCSSSSQKENAVSVNNIISPSSSKRHSPDIFAVDEVKPSPKANEINRKMSLAAKLAAKHVAATAAKTLMPLIAAPLVPATAARSTSAVLAYAKESTPPPIAAANSCLANYERSPSLFDMYLQHAQKRSSKLLHQKQEAIPSSPTSSTTLRHEMDDSVIAVVQRKTSKRKIFDSDSEIDNAENDAMELDAETDCEEIAATQQLEPKERILTQRKKRRRVCDFIEFEAEASGSDEDEVEESVGHYLIDSVIVQSSDEEHNVSPTQKQAMYLKSIKSPQHRPGAFKMPSYRVFNDQSRIFSQMAPVENSQYADDSFVVHETEEQIIAAENPAEQSLCPLEKAEKILAERRRIKRQLGRLAGTMGRKSRRNFSRQNSRD